MFVADRQNDRIQIFGPTGEYLSEWIDVRRPQDIFIRDGLVYVGELLYRKGDVSLRRGTIGQDEPNRLSIYDLEGNCVLRWGDMDGTGTAFSSLPTGSGLTTKDPSTSPRSPTPSCPGWVWACRRLTPSRSSPEPDITPVEGRARATWYARYLSCIPGRDEGRSGGTWSTGECWT